MYEMYTHAHPCDVKENGMHQTRAPSSFAPWSSSGVYLHMIEAFHDGTYYSAGLKTHAYTFVSEAVLTSLVI